ncbi:MAG: ribonuclease HII [Bdellovibrionota bacterium]
MHFEYQSGYPSEFVAGVDEVGRGCLAGPVVAAAVVLPTELDLNNECVSQITDSKLLTHIKRVNLAAFIQEWAGAWAIGSASVEEIDKFNILKASLMAMTRAVEALGQQPKHVLPGHVLPKHVLVDGKFIPPGLPCKSTAVVGGDARCLSIAAASIVAKVWRDTHMAELESVYPGYGFGQHKGYPTAVHLDALGRFGVTKIHRVSFGPVREILTAGRGVQASATNY